MSTILISFHSHIWLPPFRLLYNLVEVALFFYHFKCLQKYKNNMKDNQKKMEDKYFIYEDIPKVKLTNAGEEFLKAIKGHRVICADITLFYPGSLVRNFHVVLKKRYSKHQFQYFLNVLKHCWYDGGRYRCIRGVVWCSNGVWFERAERYGCGKGWIKICHPVIPPELC